MTLTRVALIGCVIACGWAAWPRQPTVVDTHGATRKFVIHSTLDRVTDPIVVLGDSIVEGSTLPRSLCGRPVVNAGIGGLSTTSALKAGWDEVLRGKRAALIVVSLGTNDAAIPNSAETFAANYGAFLAALAPFAERRAIVGVPPAEAGLPEARKIDHALIDRYNATLPDVAITATATLIDLPAMPPRHTFDGVHLNATGYAIWEKAVADGIQAILCAPKS